MVLAVSWLRRRNGAAAIDGDAAVGSPQALVSTHSPGPASRPAAASPCPLVAVRRRGARGGLGDPHHRRAQESIGDGIARLQYLGHGARRLLGGCDLEHRLVAVVVEFVADLGHHLGDLMPLERVQERFLRERDAVGQVPDELDILAGPWRHRVQGAAEVVGDLQELAREVADRVFVRLFQIAHRTTAQVLGLGEGAQQTFFGVLELGLELGLARRARLLGRRFRPALGRPVAFAGSVIRRLVRLGFVRLLCVGMPVVRHALRSSSGLPRRREITRAV